MSHLRISKNKKAVKRLHTRQGGLVESREMDQRIVDTVLNRLYNNSTKNMLHLESEIYAPANIQLPPEDAERVWEVMISTGLVTPVIGFGNSGKVELTRAGYQLMAQYGGYSQYLATVNQPPQPQTIILPIQIQEEPQPGQTQIVCEEEEGSGRKLKRRNRK